MSDDTCKLPTCDKPVKRTGYCYGHYMKNWRYGTPTPQFDPMWVDVIGQRFGTLVVQERRGDQWLCQCDCGRTRQASAGELNRAGAANTCGHKPTHYRIDTAGYGAAHARCTSDRGPIASHTCTDCGARAQHWSYNHDDPDEMLGTTGYSDRPVAYSLNPHHYSPRCVSCHKRFDLDHINAASIDQ